MRRRHTKQQQDKKERKKKQVDTLQEMARNIYVLYIYIYFGGVGGGDAAEDLSWVIRSGKERKRTR